MDLILEKLRTLGSKIRLKRSQKMSTNKRFALYQRILNNYESMFKNENISIITEFIIKGYIHKETLLIPDIIIHIISKFYGNISQSNIINDAQWSEFISMISKELNNNDIILHKIFEGEIDGFDPDPFHNKCDNKGPTLCIIKNNYDFIFGGYTSKSWRNPNVRVLFRDENAFLYGIYPKMFIMNIKDEYVNAAIEHNDEYSIVFGQTDLYLGYACNIFDKGTGSWVTNYERNGHSLVTDSQYNTKFAFTVHNYEVFTVKLNE